ncbi:MAG TPA: HDOD domain-containing protein [Thermoleophilaceae bacterium]|nr:HDOD domain-containing protein [Thermoleophilaceae bacterium]
MQTLISNTPASAAKGIGRPSEGHGRRLTAAFEALEAFPALEESRTRVLRVVGEVPAETGKIVEAIESDVALVSTVLRIANGISTPRRGKIADIREAVEILGHERVEQLAQRAQTFDFFERSPGWDVMPERFRLHAVATQAAADKIAREIGFEDRDALLTAALVHDIGKLVLVQSYPAYPEQIHGDARTPGERVHRERLELGVDHAVVGGVLARRWGLPDSLATSIERHHSEDADGTAAMVRLADMLAHYGQGEPIDRNELLGAGMALDLTPDALRSMMYEFPYGADGNGGGRRHVDPCPLSKRELDVLRKLAEGKVYKQIAGELELSTSTVRTHLHNTYAKLGAADRAQAVLTATSRGWI